MANSPAEGSALSDCQVPTWNGGFSWEAICPVVMFSDECSGRQFIKNEAIQTAILDCGWSTQLESFWLSDLSHAQLALLMDSDAVISLLRRDPTQQTIRKVLFWLRSNATDSGVEQVIEELLALDSGAKIVSDLLGWVEGDHNGKANVLAVMLRNDNSDMVVSASEYWLDHNVGDEGGAWLVKTYIEKVHTDEASGRGLLWLAHQSPRSYPDIFAGIIEHCVNEDTLQRAREWLRDFSLEGRDWSAILSGLLLSSDPEALKAVLAHLESISRDDSVWNRNYASTKRFLKSVSDSGGGMSVISDFWLAWLRTSSQRPGWPSLIAACRKTSLSNSSEVAVLLAKQWIELEHHEQDEPDLVLCLLLDETGDQKSVRHAKELLTEYPNKKHLLCALLRAAPDADSIGRAKSMIAASPIDGDTYFLLSNLLAVNADPDVLRFAHEWLAANTDHDRALELRAKLTKQKAD
jgi:hypothetical protein